MGFKTGVHGNVSRPQLEAARIPCFLIRAREDDRGLGLPVLMMGELRSMECLECAHIIPSETVCASTEGARPALLFRSVRGRVTLMLSWWGVSCLGVCGDGLHPARSEVCQLTGAEYVSQRVADQATAVVRLGE